MVKPFNRSGQLVLPVRQLIARQLLREQDSLQLTELHPTITRCCVLNFRKTAGARVEKADGFRQQGRNCRPVFRRGLILIDPPYEMKTDYQAVVAPGWRKSRRTWYLRTVVSGGAA